MLTPRALTCPIALAPIALAPIALARIALARIALAPIVQGLAGPSCRKLIVAATSLGPVPGSRARKGHVLTVGRVRTAKIVRDEPREKAGRPEVQNGLNWMVRALTGRSRASSARNLDPALTGRNLDPALTGRNLDPALTGRSLASSAPNRESKGPSQVLAWTARSRELKGLNPALSGPLLAHA
jgi:hypothetical protein